MYTIISSPVPGRRYSIILHDLIDDVFKMDDMTPLSVFLTEPQLFFCYFFFFLWLAAWRFTFLLLHGVHLSCDVIDFERDVRLSENVESTDEDRGSGRLFLGCLPGIKRASTETS